MTGQENANIIEKHLQDHDWKYERTDTPTGAVFTGGVGGLGGAYDSVKFAALAEENFIQSYAILPAKAKEKLPEMAQFLHGANYGMKQGAFELDWADGEVRFHMSYPDCVLLTEDKDACLLALLVLPAKMIGQYSKGIAAILLGLATPEDALKMCEGEES